jgi:hypothetical protein
LFLSNETLPPSAYEHFSANVRRAQKCESRAGGSKFSQLEIRDVERRMNSARNRAYSSFDLKATAAPMQSGAGRIAYATFS